MISYSVKAQRSPLTHNVPTLLGPGRCVGLQITANLLLHSFMFKQAYEFCFFYYCLNNLLHMDCARLRHPLTYTRE